MFDQDFGPTQFALIFTQCITADLLMFQVFSRKQWDNNDLFMFMFNVCFVCRKCCSYQYFLLLPKFCAVIIKNSHLILFSYFLICILKWLKYMNSLCFFLHHSGLYATYLYKLLSLQAP